jgi:predicted solute-binding protein
MGRKVRIGSVGYLNAKPLTVAIDRSRYDVEEHVPSEIARKLHGGEVDVALVPVAAVFAQDGWRIVGGLCIGCDGPVHSVLLVGERPPEEWTTLVLDGDSRTSAMLTKVLLAGPLAERMAGIEVVDGPPGCGRDRARGTTGALVIGDAARELPDRIEYTIDLGEVWHAWTGHPFVFAVWAGRPDLPGEVAAHLRAAASEGLARRASLYAGDDLEYVTKHIRYDLNDRWLIGLRRFAALARAQGLVEHGEIELYGPPDNRLARLATKPVLERAAAGEALSADDLARLAVDAKTSDLGVVAQLRTGVTTQDQRASVGWRLGLNLETSSLDDERLAAAAEAGVEEVLLATTTTQQEIEAVREALPEATLSARPTTPNEVARLHASGVRRLAADTTGLWTQAFHERRGTTAQASERRSVLESALAHGWSVDVTMGIGQGERVSERLEHLRLVESFHTEHGLQSFRVWAAEAAGKPAGSEHNTAEDLVRWTALARLALSVPSLEASPSTEGVGLAQASLGFGCDHFGTAWLPDDLKWWVRTVEQVRHHLEVSTGPRRRTLVSPT